jgi:hypothetical protein
MKIHFEEEFTASVYGSAGYHLKGKRLSDRNVIELMWNLKDAGFEFEPRFCERTFDYSPCTSDYTRGSGMREATFPMKAKVKGVNARDLAYHLVNTDFDVKIIQILRSRSLAPEGVFGMNSEFTSGVHISVDSRGYADKSFIEKTAKLFELIIDFYSEFNSAY